MLKFANRLFIKEAFTNEAEIDAVVAENSDYIFGASSVYLPKRLIKTKDGAGTIPDGFAIDFSTKQWFIIEAEVSNHPVWTHIAPQIAKQVTASSRSETKKMLSRLFLEEIKNNKGLLEKLSAENIPVIHIYREITEIFEKDPNIGLPIDEISDDLKDWTDTFKYDVKLWKIGKYMEFGHPENIIYEFPEESRPTYVSKKGGQEPEEIARYDVKIIDLVNSQLLRFEQSLFLSYKPQNGKKQDFEALIRADGALLVMDQVFSSPSYAALYCIKAAGSPRTTVNGWSSWKDSTKVPLSKIREKYLDIKKNSRE